MDDQPLQSEADYERALKEIEALWNAPLGTPEGARLNQRIRLVD